MKTKIKNSQLEVEVKKKEADKSEVIKSVQELRERINKERKELNALHMQKIRFTLKNTSALRVKRDQIARLFTALKKTE